MEVQQDIKHYIRVKGDGRIIDGYSDAFRDPQEGDICINFEGGYQFRLYPDGDENPPLLNASGICLYEYIADKIIRRSDDEVQADTDALPIPEPSPDYFGFLDELMEVYGYVERESGRRLGYDLLQNRALSSLTFVVLAHAKLVDDVTIVENSDYFPVWDEYWRGKAGYIVWDEGSLYRSIHDVADAGQNRKPSETPSMWTKIGDPSDEWPPWSQPLGAHDAYPAGAKVTHNDKRWINSHGDGNIWEPGVFGWGEAE
jgi:hypothetical protein